MVKRKQIERNRRNVFLEEHFIGDASLGGSNSVFVATSGTGAQVTNTASASEVDRPGIARLLTGSGTATNTNWALMRISNTINFGGNNAWDLHFIFRMASVMPTLTENYIIRLGFGDSLSGSSAPVDGIYLSFDASNTELMWNVVSNGTLAQVASGVVPAQWTWYFCTIDVAQTFATCSINGTVRSMPLANVPRGTGRDTGINFGVTKSAGISLSAMIDIDYFSMLGQLA